MASARTILNWADRPTRAKALAVLLLLPIPVVGLFAGYWLKQNNYLPAVVVGGEPAPTNPTPGMGTPVRNALASEFADADGDLLADPPTDPAALVDPEELVVLLPRLTDGTPAAESWQPLADHLARATGRPVRFFPEQVEARLSLRPLQKGEVHVMLVPSGNVPRAVNAAGFVPVVRLPGGGGNGTTRSVLLAPADEAAASLQDVRGREVLFVHPSSGAGFKVPVTALKRLAYLSPERGDFSYDFGGTERAAVEAVRDQRRLAAVSKDELDRAVAAGEISADDFVVLHTSAPVPTAAIGYPHKLAPGLARKVREALLSFDWRGTPLDAHLHGEKTTFVPTDFKADWELLREIDEAIGFYHSAE